MDVAQGGFGAREASSLLEDDAVLKSPKVEKTDEQDEKEEILATIQEEEMLKEPDSNVQSCFLTNSELTADTEYSENLVTNLKTYKWIKNEPYEDTSNLGNKASNDAVLLKPPKVEITVKQDEDEEIPVTIKEEMLTESDSNIQSCFSTDGEFTADNQYSENLASTFKTPNWIKIETSEETPDLGNKASGADVGVSFEPDETFICNDCGKQFNKKPQMIQLTLFLNTTSNGYFNCPECDYRTLIRDTLEKHLRIHDKTQPHQCDDCGRRFIRNSVSQQHTKIQLSVDKEKAYKTNRLSNLKEQLNTHKGEKPFTCRICGHKFTAKSTLNRHIRVHTGEKPFCCSTCGQNFSNSSYLKDHQRVHTGEKPFSCHMCTYQCSRKSNLQTHMRVHTGEQPFSCLICGHKFTTKSTLDGHIRVHTGEKPFSCSVCTYKCSRQRTLKQHMIVHTGHS